MPSAPRTMAVLPVRSAAARLCSASAASAEAPDAGLLQGLHRAGEVGDGDQRHQLESAPDAALASTPVSAAAWRSVQITARAPKAAAERRMAPTLWGSVT